MNKITDYFAEDKPIVEQDKKPLYNQKIRSLSAKKNILKSKKRLATIEQTNASSSSDENFTGKKRTTSKISNNKDTIQDKWVQQFLQIIKQVTEEQMNAINLQTDWESNKDGTLKQGNKTQAIDKIKSLLQSNMRNLATQDVNQKFNEMTNAQKEIQNQIYNIDDRIQTLNYTFNNTTPQSIQMITGDIDTMNKVIYQIQRQMAEITEYITTERSIKEKYQLKKELEDKYNGQIENFKKEVKYENTIKQLEQVQSIKQVEKAQFQFELQQFCKQQIQEIWQEQKMQYTSAMQDLKLDKMLTKQEAVLEKQNTEQQIQTKLEDLENRLKTYCSTYTQNQLKQSIDSISIDINALQVTATEFQTQQAIMDKKFQEIEQNYKQYQASLISCKTQVDLLQQMCSDLKEDIANHKHLINEDWLRSKVKEYSAIDSNTIEQLKKSTDIKININPEINNKLNNNQTDGKQPNNQEKEINKKIEDLVEKKTNRAIEDLRMNLVTVIVEKNMEYAEKKDTDKIEQQIQNVDKQLLQCKNIIKEYDVKIQNLNNAQEAAINNRLDDLTTQLAQIKQATESNQNTQTQYADKQQVMDINKKISRIQEQLQQIQNQLEDTKNKIENIDLRKSVMESLAKEKQPNELQHQISLNKDKIDRMDNQIRQLNENLQNALQNKIDLDILFDCKEQNAKQMANLQNQMEQINIKYAEIMADINKYVQEAIITKLPIEEQKNEIKLTESSQKDAQGQKQQPRKVPDAKTNASENQEEKKLIDVLNQTETQGKANCCTWCDTNIQQLRQWINNVQDTQFKHTTLKTELQKSKQEILDLVHTKNEIKQLVNKSISVLKIEINKHINNEVTKNFTIMYNKILKDTQGKEENSNPNKYTTYNANIETENKEENSSNQPEQNQHDKDLKEQEINTNTKEEQISEQIPEEIQQQIDELITSNNLIEETENSINSNSQKETQHNIPIEYKSRYNRIKYSYNTRILDIVQLVDRSKAARLYQNLSFEEYLAAQELNRKRLDLKRIRIPSHIWAKMKWPMHFFWTNLAYITSYADIKELCNLINQSNLQAQEKEVAIKTINEMFEFYFDVKNLDTVVKTIKEERADAKEADSIKDLAKQIKDYLENTQSHSNKGKYKTYKPKKYSNGYKMNGYNGRYKYYNKERQTRNIDNFKYKGSKAQDLVKRFEQYIKTRSKQNQTKMIEVPVEHKSADDPIIETEHKNESKNNSKNFQ